MRLRYSTKINAFVLHPLIERGERNARSARERKALVGIRLTWAINGKGNSGIGVIGFPVEVLLCKPLER